MKYSNVIISATAMAFLATGCVKPAAEQQVVYDNSQPTATTTTAPGPVIYEDPNAISSSGVIYSDIPADNTVITTTGTYQPEVINASPVYTDTTYTGGSTTSTPTYSSAPSYPSTPTYNDPYAGGATNTVYDDPYANGGGSSYPSSQPVSSYPSAPSSGGGGIQLQIAALRNYASAEDFKNSLSLDPKYSAYVQRGAVNKVIVTGIGSRAEANELKATRFPGAFIVHGSGGGGSSYSAPASTGSYDYTVNDPYGSPSSSTTSSSSTSGVGVQIAAYTNRSKAQSAANRVGGRYPAVVKSKRVKGRMYYKVILTGFSSTSQARAYIAQRGKGFVVHF